MTINNILGQPADSFDPERAAMQARTIGAIDRINHPQRDPRAVKALQELGRRLVEAVTDVDGEYDLSQYLTDLQLVVNGPGKFNLFLNEVDNRAKTEPIPIGKEKRSIQLYEDTHGKQESREGGPSQGSSPTGPDAGSAAAAGSSGGPGPAAPPVEVVPRITELLS